jgi:hypothetical protein
MTKQEIKILSKIIKEISLFLYSHGYSTFEFETYRKEEDTFLIYKVKNIKSTLVDLIKEKINRERELEVETYGWELMGDMDSKDELEIVGLLIDNVDIKVKNEEHVFTFYRKNRYKT